MWVYLYPNNTEKPLKNAYIGEYLNVQTFDFQNDWSLNRTGVMLNVWQPFYTSWEWWTVGNSSSSTYQEEILPPNSVYDWKTLQKVKIWLYKWVGWWWHTVWAWVMKVGWTPYVCWTQTSDSAQAMLYDGSEHRTNTTDETGEVVIEYVCNDDGTFTLSINWWTPYNLGNYATLFRNARSDWTLWLSIWRWREADWNIYIRKVEITTA